MNASLKTKLVAGFILAFLAGAISGAFFTFHEGHHWHGRGGRHAHSMTERMRHRMQTELDLTPQQMSQIAPILDRAGKQLQQIRAETGAKVRQVMRQTHEAVKPLLSETQREKLGKMDELGPGKRGLHRPSRRHPPPSEEPDAE